MPLSLIQAKANLIAETVRDFQGMKATELAVQIALEFNSADEFHACLELAIESKLIIPICYVLPTLKYRTKMFLLPADTEITEYSIL